MLSFDSKDNDANQNLMELVRQAGKRPKAATAVFVKQHTLRLVEHGDCHATQ
jgi:hypothetical protein